MYMIHLDSDMYIQSINIMIKQIHVNVMIKLKPLIKLYLQIHKALLL